MTHSTLTRSRPRGFPMTINEWTDRMLDDLAARHEKDMEAQAKALSDAQIRSERMLESIGRACERHTQSVRDEVLKQGDKLDELAGAQKFTAAQKTTMITAGIAGVATVVATVLTGGPA